MHILPDKNQPVPASQLSGSTTKLQHSQLAKAAPITGLTSLASDQQHGGVAIIPFSCLFFVVMGVGGLVV